MANNMVTAYLSLGSNMDDRMAYLSQAEAMLSTYEGIIIKQSSKVYETEPWDEGGGEAGEKWFLNQVVEVETTLLPQELLNAVQGIEKAIGRTKSHHWGPREIDIDILLYGNQIFDSPELEIPHRHMDDRRFILIPLLEIAPKLRHPGTGKPYKEILEELTGNHKVTPFL